MNQYHETKWTDLRKHSFAGPEQLDNLLSVQTPSQIITTKIDGPINYFHENRWTNSLIPRQQMDRLISTMKLNGPIRESTPSRDSSSLTISYRSPPAPTQKGPFIFVVLIHRSIYDRGTT